MSEIRETVLIEECTLANVIWRKFGRQPIGLIEKVIERNPGICSEEIIPVGTVIIFPVSDMAEASPRNDVVRLWD